MDIDSHPEAVQAGEPPTDQTPQTDAAAAEIAALKAELAAGRTELQYARADVENVRKRAERTSVERTQYARKALLAKILPTLDNLQRALAFDDSAGLRGGLQATLRSFEGVLAAEGVVAYDTLGTAFDPRTAEAVSTRETSEHDDDVIVDELQKGYRLGDDLLRPAMVVVAKRV